MGRPRKYKLENPVGVISSASAGVSQKKLYRVFFDGHFELVSASSEKEAIAITRASVKRELAVKKIEEV